MAQIRVCHLIFIHEHNHSATISISTQANLTKVRQKGRETHVTLHPELWLARVEDEVLGSFSKFTYGYVTAMHITLSIPSLFRMSSLSCVA